MSEVLAGTRLTPKEYVSLAREYHVRLKTEFTPPCLPTTFGRVDGKESGEILAYLWFSEARSEWWMFSPDDATEAVEALFT